MKISIDSLRAFCVASLRQVGLSVTDAETTADALVTTDAMGVFTHGTKLLAGYLHRLRGGGYRATGAPHVEREGPAWAVIDGESALGQIGSMFAMRTAMAMTWQVGSWIFDEPNQPSKHNAAFIAIDVATIAPPDEFAARVQSLIAEIHKAPTAAGIERVLLPGEREWNLHRTATVHGIDLPADVVAKLMLIAQETEIDLQWSAS